MVSYVAPTFSDIQQWQKKEVPSGAQKAKLNRKWWSVAAALKQLWVSFLHVSIDAPFKSNISNKNMPKHIKQY